MVAQVPVAKGVLAYVDKAVGKMTVVYLLSVIEDVSALEIQICRAWQCHPISLARLGTDVKSP